MKVATWNVNGIRARASQVREWLERERPDVVCLQELKAELTQIPEECRLAGHHSDWHGRKGYLGVALHHPQEMFAPRPPYKQSPVRIESRASRTWGECSIPTMQVCSPGGRRGETCARAISAGGWITCSPHPPSRRAPPAAW